MIKNKIIKYNESESDYMKIRTLGKTGLKVSEIGFGGEWLERHPNEEGIQLIKYASAKGINILDCWMADPKSRDIIGEGLCISNCQCTISFLQRRVYILWSL